VRGFPTVIVAGALTLASVGGAAAQERTLNQGHPVRLDDAYPIAPGDSTLLLDGGVRTQMHGSNRGVFPLDAQYAILPNTQLSVGTVLTTAPHETADPGSGDLNLAARVLLGRQTSFLPTMAAQVGVALPTGVDSRAVDVQLKGLASRAVTLGLLPLQLHLNGAAQFRATHLADDEHLVRYHLVTGASFAVPQQATTTLVGDVFADESVKRGQSPTVGVEVGFRHRVSPRVAVGGAIGRDVAGPRDRSPFFATLGMSVDFELPAFQKPSP
jgi:hypothetical protein